MRYPNAIWVPGPRHKVQGRMTVRGVTGHSAVGYAAGLKSVLYYEPWAWHFSALYNGTVWQHYEPDEIVPHGHGSNVFAVGIEHEGGAVWPYNEPLRPAQLAASIDLVRWLSAQYGFPLERHNGLWEHNEFANKPCPSGRIPWHLYPYPAEEEEVPQFTDDEANALRVIAPLWAELQGLVQWRRDVVPIIDDLAAEEAREDALENPPPAAVTYTVKAGETLGMIAARFGVTLDGILRANPTISDPNRISAGQEIFIP